MCVEKANLSWDDIDRDFQYFLQGDDNGCYDGSVLVKDNCFENMSDEDFSAWSNDVLSKMNFVLPNNGNQKESIDFDNLCERVAECAIIRPSDDMIIATAAQIAYHNPNVKIDSNYWRDKNGFLQLSSLVKKFIANGYDIEECLRERINCFGQLDISAQILATMKNADRIRYAMGW